MVVSGSFSLDVQTNSAPRKLRPVEGDEPDEPQRQLQPVETAHDEDVLASSSPGCGGPFLKDRPYAQGRMSRSPRDS